MTASHWSTGLILFFPPGQSTTLPIEINPDVTRTPMVVVASRIKGLLDALGPTTDDGTDPLADEAPADLLWLLDHLNRTAEALRDQEDRLIGLLREQDVSYARIGTALEMSAPGVKKRVERNT